MKALKILVVIFVLVVSTYAESYAQIGTESMTIVVPPQPETEKSPQYQKAIKRYPFINQNPATLTTKERDMLYRFVDAYVSKTECKDGQIELMLKKSDLRKAKLPVDLYYIALQSVKAINRGLQEEKKFQSNEQLQQMWEDSQAQQRAKSKAYWQSRKVH